MMMASEAFETDSAMGSSHDDSRSIHSTSSNGGERDVGFNSETSSVGMGADVENNNNDREMQDSGHCAVAVFSDQRLAVLIKVSIAIVTSHSKSIICSGLYVNVDRCIYTIGSKIVLFK